MKRFRASGVSGWLGVAILLGGCATATKGKPLDQVYAEAEGEPTRMAVEVMKEKFDEAPPLGSEERYVPLQRPAETLAIWFTHRQTADRFEQGHWVIIKLDDGGWNEDIIQHKTGGQGDSPFESLPYTTGEDKKPEAK